MVEKTGLCHNALMARRALSPELDSVYFLKILLFFILGAIWLRLSGDEILPGISSLPVGFLIGLLFARHEHFMIDRKIEYVVLLIAAILSYAVPVGIVLGV